MKERLQRLARRFERRTLTVSMRLQSLLHRQRRELEAQHDDAAGWLDWPMQQGRPAALRPLVEQAELHARQVVNLVLHHEVERRDLETEWQRLDETARLLNRAASRRARRSIDTGGEE